MKKSFYLTLLVGLLLMGSSCQDFLEEQPKGQIAATAFYNTVAETTQALTGVYTFLRPLYTGTSATFASEMATDVFTIVAGAGGANVSNFDAFIFQTSDISLLTTYRTCYQLINATNVLLANLETKKLTGDQTKLPILEGEARFLRAFAYYHLVQLFGDVPLRTEPSTAITGLDIPRTAVAKVYETILADLAKATAQIPEQSQGVGRANKLAALTLLSKVQLSLGQYDAATTTLRQVIGKRALYKEYADVFKLVNENNTVESIFEVQYGILPYNHDLIPYFTPNIVTEFGFVYQVYAPTKEAIASFAAADKRAPVTFWSSYNGKTFPQPFVRKYNDVLVAPNTADAAGQVNIPVYRYADVLLLLAEAINGAQKGPNAEALDALNQVRTRAGLTPVAAGLSQAQFLDALLEERLREFLGEGHRWFDLKRTGQLARYLTKYGFKIGTHEVFPIPRAELDANKNVTQNPGY